MCKLAFMPRVHKKKPSSQFLFQNHGVSRVTSLCLKGVNNVPKITLCFSKRRKLKLGTLVVLCVCATAFKSASTLQQRDLKERKKTQFFLIFY